MTTFISTLVTQTLLSPTSLKDFMRITTEAFANQIDIQAWKNFLISKFETQISKFNLDLINSNIKSQNVENAKLKFQNLKNQIGELKLVDNNYLLNYIVNATHIGLTSHQFTIQNLIRKDDLELTSLLASHLPSSLFKTEVVVKDNKKYTQISFIGGVREEYKIANALRNLRIPTLSPKPIPTTTYSKLDDRLVSELSDLRKEYLHHAHNVAWRLSSDFDPQSFVDYSYMDDNGGIPLDSKYSYIASLEVYKQLINEEFYLSYKVSDNGLRFYSDNNICHHINSKSIRSYLVLADSYPVTGKVRKDIEYYICRELEIDTVPNQTVFNILVNKLDNSHLANRLTRLYKVLTENHIITNEIGSMDAVNQGSGLLGLCTASSDLASLGGYGAYQRKAYVEFSDNLNESLQEVLSVVKSFSINDKVLPISTTMGELIKYTDSHLFGGDANITLKLDMGINPYNNMPIKHTELSFDINSYGKSSTVEYVLNSKIDHIFNEVNSKYKFMTVAYNKSTSTQVYGDSTYKANIKVLYNSKEKLDAVKEYLAKDTKEKHMPMYYILIKNGLLFKDANSVMGIFSKAIYKTSYVIVKTIQEINKSYISNEHKSYLEFTTIDGMRQFIPKVMSKSKELLVELFNGKQKSIRYSFKELSCEDVSTTKLVPLLVQGLDSYMVAYCKPLASVHDEFHIRFGEFDTLLDNYREASINILEYNPLSRIGFELNGRRFNYHTVDYNPNLSPEEILYAKCLE